MITLSFIKKITVTLSAVLLLFSAFVLVSCNESNEVILNVYNWGEYISDGEDGSVAVNEEFEKYFNENLSEKYGFKVKVNYTTYSSNEELYAKLKNTNTSYDVIIPSDYLVALLIREEMLHKINFDNISNFHLIDQAYIDGNYYDPTNEYSVPYNVGMIGIIYNTVGVDEADTGSWDLLWNAKYAGQILNFQNSRDGFATAQLLLGQSINSTDKSDWDAALDKLKEQKSILQGYVMDEIFIKMQGGNALIAPYYAGDYFIMYGENEDLGFYYPEEGTNFFVDAMCIPKDAKHVEEAMLYIDFMLSKEIAIANAEYICYASPNTQVIEDPEYLEYLSELHPDAIDILYPELADYKTESYLNLPADMRKYEYELWEELMVYGESDVGIYVTAAVFAVAIVAMVTYSLIKKKIYSNY